MSLVNLGLSALDFDMASPFVRCPKNGRHPIGARWLKQKPAGGRHNHLQRCLGDKEGKDSYNHYWKSPSWPQKISKNKQDVTERNEMCVCVYIHMNNLWWPPPRTQWQFIVFFYTFVARWLDSSGSRHPHLIPGLDKLAAVTRSNGERDFLEKCVASSHGFNDARGHILKVSLRDNVGWLFFFK